MTIKYVHETKAAKQISAYVILRKDGTEVATVQVYYGATVTVNVFNCGEGNKSEQFQVGRAGGYGYDKFTAALSGLGIDGHKLTDHCGEQLTPPESGVWPRDAEAPAGYRLANFSKEKNGYTNCYRLPGLEYLEALGYRVIQAI